MPLIRTALIATAACLIGAAAYAQPMPEQAPPAGGQSMPQSAPDASAPATMPDTGAAPSTGAAMPDNTGAMGAQPAAAAQTGTSTNTSTTVDAAGNQVIASQPVPDTPANRAAFGAPLSHAGRHTAPKGN